MQPIGRILCSVTQSLILQLYKRSSHLIISFHFLHVANLDLYMLSIFHSYVLSVQYICFSLNLISGQNNLTWPGWFVIYLSIFTIMNTSCKPT